MALELRLFQGMKYNKWAVSAPPRFGGTELAG